MPAMATNERIDHLERLLEVVRGLTTAPDLESFLQTVIAEAMELTNSELASILEYDDAAEELRFLSMNWFERELLRPMGVPPPVCVRRSFCSCLSMSRPLLDYCVP